MVEVVIAYMSGTSHILRMCLTKLFCYTESRSIRVIVVMDESQELDIQDLLNEFPVQLMLCKVPEDRPSVSTPHQIFLDAAFEEMSGELFLALDSDAFPVAEGWLEALIENLEGASVCGIGHCWPEPLESLDPKSMERRVLVQTCYSVPQASCFLVRRGFVEEHNLGFGQGDDTCFAITKKAQKLDSIGRLLKISHCGRPDDHTNFEPEYNRSVCLVFGGKVFHHGGASVKSLRGENDRMLSHVFQESLGRVWKEGAEFLLDEGHRYKFDKEEKVGEFRIKAVREQIVEYLTTNERLFADA